MDFSQLPREQILSILFANKFSEFVKYFWSIVSPDPLIWGRHLDALCDHLQAVGEKRIQNCLINMPPRCSKSTTACVLFPVWLWVRNPTERIMHASYSKELTVEHACQSRKLIESPEFQTVFPHIKLDPEFNTKVSYRNTEGGQRRSVSVGASTTGFSASVILCDDMHSVGEKESEINRQEAIDYFRLTLSSRAIPGIKVPRIVLGQRVHEDDVSGYIIEHSKNDPSWTFLELPMEYDPDRVQLQNKLYTDPRTTPGEILWPEAFDEERLNQIKSEHRLDYECLYNQRIQAMGHLFKREDFRYYTADDLNYYLDGRPLRIDDCARIAASDFAISLASDADYTVCMVADIRAGDIIVRYVFRRKLNGTQVVPQLKEIVKSEDCAFLIAEHAGQQKILIDQLRQAGVPVKLFRPETDKVARSLTAQIKMASHQIWLPKQAGWLLDLEKELAGFPRSKHDDQVDCLSLIAQASRNVDRGALPVPVDPEEEARRRFNRILWADQD